MIFINYSEKHHIPISTISVLLLYILLLIFSPAASKGAAVSLKLCSDLLIPSILPFLICTSLLISCNYEKLLAPVIQAPFERIFRLNSQLALPFVIGILSGYPQGAVAVNAVYEKGGCTKEEAEKALCFCNNTGVAFLFGALPAMTGDRMLGFCLFSVQLVISIAFALLSRPKSLSKKAPRDNYSSVSPPSLVAAVKSSVIPMLNICAYVIFFGALVELVYNLSLKASLPKDAVAFLFSILEISNAASYIAGLDIPVKYALMGFAVCFSGICVHMQIRSCISPELSAKKMIIAKLFQGLCAFLVMLFFKST